MHIASKGFREGGERGKSRIGEEDVETVSNNGGMIPGAVDVA